MAIITREITQTNNIQKAIKTGIENLSAFEMCEVCDKSYKENFDKGRNADGSKMASISQETIELKKRGMGKSPRKPLIFSEELRNAGTIDGDRKEATFSILNNQKVTYYNKPSNATNHEVLTIQRKANRDPFGLGKLLKKKLKDYIKSKWTILQ